MSKKNCIEFNLFDVEYSHRFNPIQNRYIHTVDDAIETASTLINSLFRKHEGNTPEDDYNRKAAENFLAACIYFFCNYDVHPYDRNGNILREETLYEESGKPYQVYYDAGGYLAEIDCYKGRYADLPHVFAFILQDDYSEIFDTLMTDELAYPLVKPLMKALRMRDYERIERMVGLLRIYIARLMTPEICWVFSADDVEFDQMNEKNRPKLLFCEKERHWGGADALNDLVLHSLHKKSGTKKIKSAKVRFDDTSAEQHHFEKKYDFGSERNKQRMLIDNYRRITHETAKLVRYTLGIDTEEIDDEESTTERPVGFTNEEIKKMFEENCDNLFASLNIEESEEPAKGESSEP